MVDPGQDANHDLLGPGVRGCPGNDRTSETGLWGLKVLCLAWRAPSEANQNCPLRTVPIRGQLLPLKTS